MRGAAALLATALAAAGCGDDATDQVPATCGAVLGDVCDASTPCDLGLVCGDTGRCECVAGDSCALACWADRAITEVVLDGELLYVRSNLATGGWDVTSVPVRGGPRRPAALGAGTARIAGHNGDLYVAAGEPGAFDWLITRRLPDGDRITQLEASLPDVHGLAASARGVAFSTDGAIWLIDPGGTKIVLAADPGDDTPRALTFDGAADLVYVNHRGDAGDQVVRLAGVPAVRSELDMHAAVSSVAACPDALYWASPLAGGFRYDRNPGATVEPLAIGRVDELTCGGTTTYWIGTEDTGVPEPQQPWAIGERTSTGALSNRHVIPYARSMLEPPQLAVDDEALYWSLGTPAGPHRVLRLER